MRYCKVFIFLVFVQCCGINLFGQKITLQIEGLHRRHGQLLICLSTKALFLDSCSYEMNVPIADQDTIDVSFHDVPAGNYAVSLFLDLNYNEQLDTRGLFKIPKEPFGFSQNPRLIFGPPGFNQCKFSHSEADLKLCIKLKSF